MSDLEIEDAARIAYILFREMGWTWQLGNDKRLVSEAALALAIKRNCRVIDPSFSGRLCYLPVFDEFDEESQTQKVLGVRVLVEVGVISI